MTGPTGAAATRQEDGPYAMNEAMGILFGDEICAGSGVAPAPGFQRSDAVHAAFSSTSFGSGAAPAYSSCYGSGVAPAPGLPRSDTVQAAPASTRSSWRTPVVERMGRDVADPCGADGKGVSAS